MEPEHDSFHCAEESVLQNMGKKREEKNPAVYLNQRIFLYFLCDPNPPAAILHLSLASAGRLVCWPTLQSLNFAFNLSLTERGRERVPDASSGSSPECQEMDLNT